MKDRPNWGDAPPDDTAGGVGLVAVQLVAPTVWPPAVPPWAASRGSGHN
jgi:hypothetical protein